MHCLYRSFIRHRLILEEGIRENFLITLSLIRRSVGKCFHDGSVPCGETMRSASKLIPSFLSNYGIILIMGDCTQDGLNLNRLTDMISLLVETYGLRQPGKRSGLSRF